jgi:hypothetical protein
MLEQLVIIITALGLWDETKRFIPDPAKRAFVLTVGVAVMITIEKWT